MVNSYVLKGHPARKDLFVKDDKAFPLWLKPTFFSFDSLILIFCGLKPAIDRVGGRFSTEVRPLTGPRAGDENLAFHVNRIPAFKPVLSHVKPVPEELLP